MIPYNTLKKQYTKLIADRLCIVQDDLSPTELEIISISFELFQDKLSDMKIKDDEIYRLTIELANLKASLDDTGTDYDE